MDIQLYLERIHYHGSLEPTLHTLCALHEAHLLAVPFENLDIHLGREIAAHVASLWTKIIEQNRGGFCYELNGLFALLLRALGFQVDMLSAAVASSTGGFGPEFDHLTLLVHLEEDWIADVGFGESFRQPLRTHALRGQHRMEAVIAWERDAGAWIYQEWDDCGSPLTALPYSHISWEILPTCADINKPPQSRILPRNVSALWQTHWKDHLERSTLDNDNRR